MQATINRKSGSLPLVGFTIFGTFFTLWVSQLVWSNNNDTRVESYAKNIMTHAESVALSISETLGAIRQLNTQECSEEDIEQMKRITFTSRFVKDAGRVRDHQILCSSNWGVIKEPYHLKGVSKNTQDNITIWHNVPNYAIKDSTIDVNVSATAYAVTSPTAYASFETPPPELSALIASANGQLIMREFGEKLSSTQTAATRMTRMCSTQFDLCVTAQIKSSIFSWAHSGILSILALLGGATGALLWYSLMQRAINRDSLESRLAAAIQTDSIQLLYQPIVQAATGTLQGVEALARWHDKELGDVPPDDFIKKASEANLAIPLNKNLIRKALIECSDRLRKTPHLYLSLNLDTECLCCSGLMEQLAADTQNLCIHPQQIAIEILEHATVEMEKLDGVIASLRDHGYQVFIDDFGTGYSSLAYLSTLKFDKIKIDKTFTQSAGTHSPAAMVLTKIHEIADSLNTPIIFEGVETEAQKQAILSFCPDALVQGWLYSKAVSIEHIVDVY